MDNILKIAENELKSSNDIIKTAAILRRLKNKLLRLFDGEQREQAEQLLDKTIHIKPLLADTYKVMRLVEEAIKDLDLDSYNTNVDELRRLVSELGNSLDEVEYTTTGAAAPIPETTPTTRVPSETPATPKEQKKYDIDWIKRKRQRIETPTDYVDKYYKIDGKLAKNLKEVGQNLGVNIQFGVNILPNREGLKPIFYTMAAVIFAGNIAPGNEVNVKNKLGGTSFEVDPKDLSELQDKVSLQAMEDIFYKEMPTFPIVGVLGREKGKEGKQKLGAAELKLIPTENGWVRLPNPLDTWLVRLEFYLVDLGDPTQPGNYKIYRQTVQAVKRIG